MTKRLIQVNDLDTQQSYVVEVSMPEGEKVPPAVIDGFIRAKRAAEAAQRRKLQAADKASPNQR